MYQTWSKFGSTGLTNGGSFLVLDHPLFWAVSMGVDPVVKMSLF